LAKIHPAESIPDQSLVEGKRGRHTRLRHQRTAGSVDQLSEAPLTVGNRPGVEVSIDLQDLQVRSELTAECLHLGGPEPCLHKRQQLRADVA
jgi:hypothetical protein